MRLRPISMVLGFLVIAAPPALADEDSGTVYSSLRGIGAFAETGRLNATSFTGATEIEIHDDEFAGVAGVLGYSFGRFPFRAEVEVTHRFRFDSDNRAKAAQIVDYETNSAATSALASAIIEWRNDSNFTLFAGVTAGWARNSADAEPLNLSAEAATDGEEATDNFAYGGTLGLDWGLSKYWSAGVAYRYLNLGDVEAGTADAADSVSADDYVSHDVLLSILYRF